MEDGRGVPSEQGSGQAEGLAANVGEDARGDALGRATSLELMDLVAYQQVEESFHPVLDVVGKRVAGGAGPVRLPEGGAAAGAGVLAAVQVGVRQGHAVLVHDLRRAVRAAGDAEGLPRLLLPYEPAPGRGPPLYHGGHPAVGQLGLLTAHHREEGAGADGEAEPLQVGDGLDDGGTDAGHRHLHLPLPLGHQVRRADDEDALEARHVRRRRVHAGVVEGRLSGMPPLPVRIVHEDGAFATVVLVVAVNVGFKPPKVGQHLLETPLIVTHDRPGFEVIRYTPVERRGIDGARATGDFASGHRHIWRQIGCPRDELPAVDAGRQGNGMAPGSPHRWGPHAGVVTELDVVGKMLKIGIVWPRFQEQDGPLGMF